MTRSYRQMKELDADIAKGKKFRQNISIARRKHMLPLAAQFKYLVNILLCNNACIYTILLYKIIAVGSIDFCNSLKKNDRKCKFAAPIFCKHVELCCNCINKIFKCQLGKILMAFINQKK